MGNNIKELHAAITPGLRNPVLLKEMRTGVRDRFPFIFLTLFLTAAACAVYFLITSALGTVSSQGGIQAAAPSALRAAYHTLFLLEMALLIFAAPLLSAGAISREREQRTLPLLLVTRLPVGEIISGKLIYTLICLLLPVAAIMPINGFFWLIGIVGGREMFGGLLLLGVCSGLVAVLGIYFSTRSRHTITALFYTYGVLGALTALFFTAPDFFKGIESIPLFGIGIPAYALLVIDFFLIGTYLFLASVSYLRTRKPGADLLILFLFYAINLLAISGLVARHLVLMPDPELLPGAGRFWLCLTMLNLALTGVFGMAVSWKKKSLPGRLFSWIPILLGGASLLSGAVFINAGFSWEKILTCAAVQFLYPAVFLMAAQRFSTWGKRRINFLLIYFPLFLSISFIPYLFIASGSFLHRLLALSPLLSILSIWEKNASPGEVGLYTASFIIYFILWLSLSLTPEIRKEER
ncbi:MAG: ABC transporter permease [Chloroflexi bacterium]|nr:ABC transporter permease [Chloroflexota bacterium]